MRRLVGLGMGKIKSIKGRLQNDNNKREGVLNLSRKLQYKEFR